MEICVSVLDPSTGNSNCRQPGKVIVAIHAAFLTASLGIPNERTLDDATAYLGHWLSILKTDSKAIFTAASAASAAADYILSFSQTVETEEEPEAIAA